MMNPQLQTVLKWFGDYKDKAIAERITSLMVDDIVLSDKEKSCLGFILFSFSMAHGPSSFVAIEFLAEELQVSKDVQYWSQSWISYAAEKKGGAK